MSISSTKKLLAQAKKLPNSPGVYLFKKGKQILYVGKAGSLKSRVRSYFSDKGGKARGLTVKATKIDYIKTDSILEALVLEANLIKKYWPPYNVKEKDNRSFIYIVIPDFKLRDFPFPILIRERELKKYPAKYFNVFGPYQSYAVAREALRLIRKIFPYCARPNSGRPCFHYQIGQCPGACFGKIDKKDYQKIIKNLMLFLRGEKKRLIQKLKKEYPEKIEILKQIRDSALLSRDNFGLPAQAGLSARTSEGRFRGQFRIEGYDISHFSGTGTYGSMVVFKNNFPSKDEYRIFKIKNAAPNDDVGAIKEVIARRLNHPEWPYPDLILIDGGKGQVNAVSKVLKEKQTIIPVAGLAKGRDRKKDELVFGAARKNTKQMIADSKPLLQKVRNEAHRFAIKFSRKKITNIRVKAHQMK